ncbi:hypothetical protein Hanom_Chr10g00923481 [Helianthus anomalus]
MAEEEVLPVEEGAGPVPVLKWDQWLFEQIVRGFHFPGEWDLDTLSKARRLPMHHQAT